MRCLLLLSGAVGAEGAQQWDCHTEIRIHQDSSDNSIQGEKENEVEAQDLFQDAPPCWKHNRFSCQ